MDKLRQERMATIRLLVLDVDGVLTDGRLYFGPDGQEWKAFDVKDGHGIRLLLHYGVDVAVISGRKSSAVKDRLQDLGIKKHYLGFQNKVVALEKLLDETKVAAEHVACMGDDLPDLSLMQRVGFACAPADAHPEVLHRADWVSSAAGGCGAVRELAEMLLKQRAQWRQVMEYCLS